MANVKIKKTAEGKSDYYGTVKRITKNLNKIIREQIANQPEIATQLHTYSAKDTYDMILKTVEAQKGTPSEGTTSVYKEVRKFNSLLTQAKKKTAFKIRENARGAQYTDFTKTAINRDTTTINQINRTLADKYANDPAMLKELGLRYRERVDFKEITPAQLNKFAQQVAAYGTPEAKEFNVATRYSYNWLHALEKNAPELYEVLNAKYHLRLNDQPEKYDKLAISMISKIMNAVLNEDALTIEYIYSGTDNIQRIISALNRQGLLNKKEAQQLSDYMPSDEYE